MKTKIKMFATMFLLAAGMWMLPGTARADFGISFQVFYDELTPYGSWVDNPDYGYVWVPDCGTDFYPYATAGHWVYTGYGWTWVSDYPWGWAPFHYGRWYWDNYYGWAWIPGTDWGPGWVTWRQCDGFFGWAPLPPAFNLAWAYGWNYRIPARQWVFLPDRYFGRNDMDRYYMNRSDNDRLYNRSVVLNNIQSDRQRNTRYYAGPDPKLVRNVTGRDVRTVEIRDNSRPGQVLSDGKLQIYRPPVTRNDNRNVRTAPETYRKYYDRNGQNGSAINNGRVNERTPLPVTRTTPSAVPEQNRNRPSPSPSPVVKRTPPPQYQPAPRQRQENPPQRNYSQGSSSRVTPGNHNQGNPGRMEQQKGKPEPRRK
ncbi:MAG TPA: DUF6600 domain-containing protein [Bacteroidales bacterium]|nr:DUF6600 domain-containing protein [Bacteroidales bacterium]